MFSAWIDENALLLSTVVYRGYGHLFDESPSSAVEDREFEHVLVQLVRPERELFALVPVGAVGADVDADCHRAIPASVSA